jgi:hypothetical protein
MTPTFRRARRGAAAVRGALIVLALAAPAVPDTVTLRNGGVIRCKVVRETKDLVKVRMPHRGRIVTTFLSRGAIESIDTLPDAENRAYFQEMGVRNPAKSFEPVYYSGGRTAQAAGGKPGAVRGKGAAAGRERGIAARQKASEERAKSRRKGSKYGEKKASPSTPSSPAGGGAPISPVTTGGAITTSSGSFGARAGGGGQETGAAAAN